MQLATASAPVSSKRPSSRTGSQVIKVLAINAGIVVAVLLGVLITRENHAALVAALLSMAVLQSLAIWRLWLPLSGLETDAARLRALALNLVVRHDTYRAMVSRQLFDSVAQQLAAVQFELAAASHSTGELTAINLHHARSSVLAMLEEVRNLSGAVHPGSLDRAGLEPAIQKLARTLAKRDDVEIEVAIDHLWASTAAMPIVLYGVVEEALLNALHHGAAQHIFVTLMVRQNAAILEVSDDGRGFNPDASATFHQNGGLRRMRDQLELIGGTLHIRSRASVGTTVTASVPFSPLH